MNIPEASVTETVVSISTAGSFVKIMASPYLRRTALKTIGAIIYNFFILQYRAAILPGRIPVSKADHPLDRKIPFTPGKIAVYLDFTAFWIRVLGFLLKRFKRRALEPVKRFIETMGLLYAWAAQVYTKNLSTTERPRYLARSRFVVIHALDPHLMCIPSLHVMVVIRTYTFFRDILLSLGEAGNYAPRIEEIRQGALAISEAVLFVKQHSVNCISAAMYAMTRFDRALFPPEEAKRFASELFFASLGKEDGEEVRAHILSLYRNFVAEGEKFGRDWTEPLLGFLKTLP
ncbi:MAG: hypothetical protein LBQ67_05475 [Treponema sp.]|nr:hypothetical protein [Treponema sp.]